MPILIDNQTLSGKRTPLLMFPPLRARRVPLNHSLKTTVNHHDHFPRGRNLLLVLGI
jgi:hypothetical protein